MKSQTDGCSGAEIAALCQDAALLTMQRDMDAPCVNYFLPFKLSLNGIILR